MLRTHFVDAEIIVGGLVQVVLSEEEINRRESSDSLSTYLKSDSTVTIELGRPFLRYAVITEEAKERRTFV